MVHPYTNQKLETFTISPIVHASMMYSIVLSVLTNTCPVAILNTKSISLFFLKSIVSELLADPVCNQMRDNQPLQKSLAK